MAWTLLDSTTAGFADGSGGHAITYPGGQPASGDLLVLGVASDTTISTPSGWTLAVSDVVNQGDYLFYRLAGGGEASAVTVTTGGDFPAVAAFLRYSGAAASNPLDVTAVARQNNVDAFTSPTVSPAALAGAGELAVLLAGNQQPSAGAPTGASGSTGYSVSADTGLTGSGALGMQAYLATNTTASGSQTPQVTWATSQFLNRTSLFAAFLPAASTDATVAVPGAATATTAAQAPTVASDAVVAVPAAATAVAAAAAPAIPSITTTTPGRLAGSASRASTLSGSAASTGGPRHP